LKKRWQRCIQGREDYFEGDKAEYLQGKTGKFLRDIFGNFPDRPRIFVSFSTGIKNCKWRRSTDDIGLNIGSIVSATDVCTDFCAKMSKSELTDNAFAAMIVSNEGG